MLILVVIISGLVTFFLYRGSQDRLIDKSVDKLLETESENFATSINYVAGLITEQSRILYGDIGIEEIAVSIMENRIIDIQRVINSNYQDMVESGFLGSEIIMVILPSSQLISEPIVWMSSLESLVSNWVVPDYLVDPMDESSCYFLMEDGIPELDLEGDYLIAMGKITLPDMPGIAFNYLSIKPMSEEIAEINEYFDNERKRSDLLLLAIVGGSIFIIILITFLLLDRLIRRKITDPIDELSAVAEEVMQGNLDVDIEVRKGEEFEGLKRSFKEMVESFRKLIARSVGEE
ncbi:MAG: HAMP domain-containing protein [Actinomycetota bacterium]|nr:HAMP domain-containing protein [Actinomycetota bacterium]